MIGTGTSMSQAPVAHQPGTPVTSSHGGTVPPQPSRLTFTHSVEVQEQPKAPGRFTTLVKRFFGGGRSSSGATAAAADRIKSSPNIIVDSLSIEDAGALTSVLATARSGNSMRTLGGGGSFTTQARTGSSNR